jgi:glycerophosphoryl diester phosphodiesterase
MLILSHRGFHAHCPENTLEAFDAAARLGVDGIETDVRISADGQAILFHDRSIATGQAVASLSAADLSAGVGYHVPTLQAAVEKFPGLFWNIEIKSPDSTAAVAELVRNRGSVTRFLITSFWHNAIDELARAGIVDCGLLVAHRPANSDSLIAAPVAGSRLATIVWDYETVDDQLIREAAARGIKSFVYGLQTPAEHLRMMKLGVAGVISDHPEMAMKK